MNYRLVITTDGRPGVLDKTLRALAEHVTPRPTDVVVVDDSGSSDWRQMQTRLGEFEKWAFYPHARRQGFCRTVSDAWKHATVDGPEYVLWLEDDISFTRPVDLASVAAVLDMHPKCAQMGFMRQPVNAREQRAGSLFKLYREQYKLMDEGWLHSLTNFSTGCSLMWRPFMCANPWPRGYTIQCEGRYSIDLLHRGYHFGVWGVGDEWVHHHGVRAGQGY